MISNEISMIPLESIIVDRAARHRTEISAEKVTEIAASIEQRGLIHPILVTGDESNPVLVAGEHRLEAFKILTEAHPDNSDWARIPARFAYDYTELELRAVELEENVKRVEMSWQDRARAVADYHNHRKQMSDDWSITDTAGALCCSRMAASRDLAVAAELNSENPNPLITQSASRDRAYNIVLRMTERAIASEVSQIHRVETDEKSPPDKTIPMEHFHSAAATLPPAEERRVKAHKDDITPILVADFIEWSQDYSGPKFNLIHCDFPYGIDHHSSDQGRATDYAAYNDSPDVYWRLCSALIESLPRIAIPSCHIMFWFSMKYYCRTIKLFTEVPNLNVNPVPLIWHKSDNSGILPDPNRGPRQIYETALLMSYGDRKVVRAVSNLYAAPVNKKRLHQSEKPEPVLKHFFRMLVDEFTELLDPTCGSGSALRAAETLGAQRALGLELSPEIANSAVAEYQKAKRLKELAAEADVPMSQVPANISLDSLEVEL